MPATDRLRIGRHGRAGVSHFEDDTERFRLTVPPAETFIPVTHLADR